MIFRNISRFLKKSDLHYRLLSSKASEQYNLILKFWFGDDLNSISSDAYVPNFKLWFMGISYNLIAIKKILSNDF
jgi:hypothetical protein